MWYGYRAAINHVMTNNQSPTSNNSKKLLNDNKKNSSMMSSMQRFAQNKKIEQALEVIDIVTAGDFMQNIIQLKEDPKSIEYVSWEKISKQDDSADDDDDDDIPAVDDMDYAQRIKIMRKGARIFYSKDRLDSALHIINNINDDDFLDETSKNKKERDVKSKEWIEAKKEIQEKPTRITKITCSKYWFFGKHIDKYFVEFYLLCKNCNFTANPKKTYSESQLKDAQ